MLDWFAALLAIAFVALAVTYDVRFRSQDLWPDSSDDALVHVGVFQSYLERAPSAAVTVNE